MKKMKKIGCILLILMSFSLYADNVNINGIAYSCTNTCVITTIGPGVFSVNDSGGGTVTMTFEP
jgi:hypothetical protein